MFDIVRLESFWKWKSTNYIYDQITSSVSTVEFRMGFEGGDDRLPYSELFPVHFAYFTNDGDEIIDSNPFLIPRIAM